MKNKMKNKMKNSCISNRRSEKELFLRNLGRLLGIGFRFHKREKNRKTHGVDPANTTRYWSFEYWKKITGNPLNHYSKLRYDKFYREHRNEIEATPYGERGEKYRLPMGMLEHVEIPKSLDNKDDVIDYILFKSDFMTKVEKVIRSNPVFSDYRFN